ncbi:MAG: hypothetical protein WC624_01390 [Candidatus Margulisiibacteriota bacterium]
MTTEPLSATQRVIACERRSQVHREVSHQSLISGGLADIRLSSVPITSRFNSRVYGLENDIFFPQQNLFLLNFDNSTYLAAAIAVKQGMISPGAKFFTLDGHYDLNAPELSAPKGDISIEEAAEYVSKINITDQISAMAESGFISSDHIYICVPGVEERITIPSWIIKGHRWIRGYSTPYDVTLMPLTDWLQELAATDPRQRIAHVDIDYLATPRHGLLEIAPTDILPVNKALPLQLGRLLRGTGFMDSGLKVVVCSPEFMPPHNFLESARSFTGTLIGEKYEPITALSTLELMEIINFRAEYGRNFCRHLHCALNGSGEEREKAISILKKMAKNGDFSSFLVYHQEASDLIRDICYRRDSTGLTLINKLCQLEEIAIIRFQ